MNLLIVDDEAIYRNGMAEIIRRHRPELAVFEAANGAEALEILEKTQIDGMFLDIRMPRCDGLAVLDEMKRAGIENVVTVIVSGVNDFEYARSAIKGKVFEYLLKPITPREALDMLARIEREVAVRRKRREELAALREIVAQNREEMRLQLFQDVLSGMYAREELLRRGDFLDVNLRGEEFLCAALELVKSPQEDDSPLERQMYILRAQSLFSAFLEAHPDARLFHIHLDQFVLLFCAEKAGQLQVTQIIEALDRFVDDAFEAQGITLTAGVAETCHALAHISMCYAEAVRALRYKTMLDSRETYSIKDFRRTGRGYYIADYDQFSVQIRSRNLPALQRSIRETLESAAAGNADGRLSGLMLACNELLLTICKIMNENGMDISAFFTPGNLGMAIPDRLRSLRDICDWFDALTERTVAAMTSRSQAESGHLVQRVRAYVAENYARPVNNALVADAFGYSPNYLGRVFRNETGVGLNEYIKDVRIDRAKELLANTSLRIIEIAQQTGFSDNQYFSVVFRHKLGCAPSEYREMVQSGRGS